MARTVGHRGESGWDATLAVTTPADAATSLPASLPAPSFVEGGGSGAGSATAAVAAAPCRGSTATVPRQATLKLGETATAVLTLRAKGSPTGRAAPNRGAAAAQLAVGSSYCAKAVPAYGTRAADPSTGGTAPASGYSTAPPPVPWRGAKPRDDRATRPTPWACRGVVVQTRVVTSVPAIGTAARRVLAIPMDAATSQVTPNCCHDIRRGSARAGIGRSALVATTTAAKGPAAP